MNIGDVDNDELVLGALSSSLAGAFGRDAVAWRCLSGRRAVSLCLDGRTRPDVLRACQVVCVWGVFYK